MKKFKAAFVILAAAVVLVSGVILTGCTPSKNTGIAKEESLLDTISKRGTIKVGLSTFVPWAMKDKNGKLIGFEVDVARRLAKDMGVKVEFIPTKWSGIIPALLTGKFDVIIGGMGIRPQRNLKVNFTIPYEYSGLALAASKKKAAGFHSLGDFNKKGVIIAARIGSTGATAVKKLVPLATLRLFDDESQMVQELLSGRVHALVASAPMPAYQVLKNPDKLFLPFEGTFTKEPIGFALRKGDYDLINFFNSWIRVVQAEGWLDERSHYWFSTKDWESQIQ